MAVRDAPFTQDAIPIMKSQFRHFALYCLFIVCACFTSSAVFAAVTNQASVSYADWAESPNYAVDVSPFDQSRIVVGSGVQWKAKNGLEASVEYEATAADSSGWAGRLKVTGSTKF